MRSFFTIHIKGKTIWKVCGLVLLCIFIFCCSITIVKLDQPTTATAGQEITIVTHDSVTTNIQNSPILANYIIGVLMPNGWDVGNVKNSTVTYDSNLGSGNMQLMPSNIIEPESASNGTNLNYSQAMKAKFKIGPNLIDDMQWVVFRSVQAISIPNTVTITGTITLKIKVGVDGNTTIFRPAYVLCESVDGLNHFNSTTPDYGYLNGPKLTVNGPGDLVDLIDPLLTSFDPPKALDNDIVTLNYNEKLDTANILKGNKLYLCVDTAYTADGKALTGFCAQTPKALFKQTSTTSGLYQLTFWPRSFFGLTTSQTLSKIVYHVIDVSGHSVGFADTNTPFTYKFRCD